MKNKYINKYIFGILMNLYKYQYIYSYNLKPENFDLETSLMRSHDRIIQQEISSFIIHDKSNYYNI